jgi:DNA-binding response OmpR family regulator
VRKVAVVDSDPATLMIVTMTLDAGAYDLLPVESRRDAYGDLRHFGPDLIVLCPRPDSPEACQLLTLLKLDALTHDIPVVTFAREEDGDNVCEWQAESRPYLTRVV